MNFFTKWFNKKSTNPYTYENIKKYNVELEFILNDIVAYNNHIKDILSNNDLLKPDDLKHVLKIQPDTIIKRKLYYWCTDNDSKLTDLNKTIYEFLDISQKLIDTFYLIKKLKGHDVDYKFNIRVLQPYIINLETIRRCLEKIK